MAPLKMEEEMKQKLEERRIEPSADAWQRLSSQLDNKDNSKPRSGFWWIGLAAACIVILLILKIRPGNNENNTVPVIVDTIEEAEGLNETVENDSQLNSAANEEEEIIPKEISEERLVESTANTNEKDAAEEVQKSRSPLVRIARAEESIPDETDRTSEEPTNILMEEKASLESKLTENTAEVTVSTEVSNAELDELLEKARKRLNSEATQKKKEISVQAQALLDGVEDDLDRSFRERVFRTLVSGYQSVRTAVAERNN